MRPFAEACSVLTPALLRRRASTAVRRQNLSVDAAQLKLSYKLACKQCKQLNTSKRRVCGVCADYCDTYLTHDSVSAHAVLPVCGPEGGDACIPLCAHGPPCAQSAPPPSAGREAGLRARSQSCGSSTTQASSTRRAAASRRTAAARRPPAAPRAPGLTRRASRAQANVRNYYMMFEHNQTQVAIETKLGDYESKSRDNFQAQVAPAPRHRAARMRGPMRRAALLPTLLPQPASRPGLAEPERWRGGRGRLPPPERAPRQACALAWAPDACACARRWLPHSRRR